MTNPWSIFWLMLAVGVVWVVMHLRECLELIGVTSTERNPYIVGIGVVAVAWCGWELAETTIMAAWLAPTMATYQECQNRQSAYLQDMLAFERMGDAKLKADEDALQACADQERALAGVGESILTHGEH